MMSDAETRTSSPAMPTLSLVIATLGRVEEVERLLQSLAIQQFTDFDVCLVDQNQDARLGALATAHWPFPVRHHHVPDERGASRARNRGWRETTGSIVLFPDDDCWFAPDFLTRAMATMVQQECDILSGRPTDLAGRTINGRFESDPQWITRENVWTTAIEWLVFFRREALEAIDGFDVDVGIGASTPWQSAEGQDILLRAIAAGYTAWYDPTLTGHHEEIVLGRPDGRVLRKARIYARGMGHVLRCHDYGMPKMANWVIRPLGGSILSLLRGRPAMARYYMQVALGRVEGAAGKLLSRD